ncbi:MAG: hypothetical protein RLZZ127_990 [Planctomycetota bacterium]|jgi:ABC-2 type transport system ATP-binding protein
MIEFHGLGRCFDGFWAVRDLTFSVPAGRICGFIGPNGAGKSTSMRILATLDLPSEGRTVVAGLDGTQRPDEVRRRLGFMPDSYGAYPNMTVAEYLDFFARAYGLHGADRRKRIADIADFCQLGGLMTKAATSLSKGMKQRLCLGRCLINDPQVLILDEPTAGLDPRARIEFRDLIRVLAGQGRTLLISSHILSELEEVCDQVAIIERGRLVADGTVAAVKARARAASQAEAAPDRRIRLELRFPAADAAVVERTLAEQPGLAGIRSEGHDCWTADAPADPAAHAAVVRALVLAGQAPCHVDARSGNLEDAFMKLTEGAVQ